MICRSFFRELNSKLDGNYNSQCLTLIFLLTCPLGNFVSSFTCQVYFFGCPKKSPPRFARCFIEFSILVPFNFMPSINPKREVLRSHCLLTVKSLHKISTLFHCNRHSHAWVTFTIHGLLFGSVFQDWHKISWFVVRKINKITIVCYIQVFYFGLTFNYTVSNKSAGHNNVWLPQGFILMVVQVSTAVLKKMNIYAFCWNESFPCNISNTRDSVSSGYPNTEKRVENTTRSRVFLTKFEVFG